MEKYIKEQKELIEKMQDFFTNIDDKKKELEMQLVKKKQNKMICYMNLSLED